MEVIERAGKYGDDLQEVWSIQLGRSQQPVCECAFAPCHIFYSAIALFVVALLCELPRDCLLNRLGGLFSRGRRNLLADGRVRRLVQVEAAKACWGVFQMAF